ncbi:hypothetical protein F2Q69_00024382 [Brassica cretica]|uniref:Uncharacterized protein n=1 Tax=Brassica cretica TaxID=69181 RepID=A0A8S9QM91_BRACR|nr:hypothetical protein F2Q69_00024382 [Brassica cretica]
MLEELNVKISLMDAIQMIPSMRSLVKGLISEKTSVDSDIMMVSKECSTVLQNRTNAALTPQQGMIEEILADDPLEVALTRAESEQNTSNIDDDGYEKMLDSGKSIEKMVAFLSLGETSNQPPPEGETRTVCSGWPFWRTDWIEGCGAYCVLTDPGVIKDWFWGAKHG